MDPELYAAACRTAGIDLHTLEMVEGAPPACSLERFAEIVDGYAAFLRGGPPATLLSPAPIVVPAATRGDAVGDAVGDRAGDDHTVPPPTPTLPAAGLVFHCRGGVGRAGMMGACLALRLGLTPTSAAAVGWVRQRRCNRAVETAKQEEFIDRYAKYIGLPTGRKLPAWKRKPPKPKPRSSTARRGTAAAPSRSAVGPGWK